MATEIVDHDEPSQWDLNLRAVIAAPNDNKVIFENQRLRVLEVILEPDEEEPTHHHRGHSVFVLDQKPIHDMTPDGSISPRIGTSFGRYKAGTARAASSSTWHHSRQGAY